MIKSFSFNKNSSTAHGLEAHATVVVVLALFMPLLARAAETFQFADGDVVVFVGNTVTERAQNYGHVETALTLAAGDGKKVTFRNLGWSGDSVYGDARSYFGPPQEGFDRLQKAVGELKPTVMFFQYGAVAAMTEGDGWTAAKAAAGHSGMDRFLFGYNRLLDAVTKSAGGQLREIVIVTPPPLENVGAPMPDQAARNKRLAEYRDAIAELARKRGYRLVDLFGLMGGDTFDGSKPASPQLTENGVHYTAEGYRKLAKELASGLGLTAYDYESGVASAEALRETIVAKNRLFFHKWRPANETYLFLFRKHEQGQNAKEIPMFDPLITEQEAQIAKLKTAVLSELGANK
jgi:lysophospholipase L1-like esterase